MRGFMIANSENVLTFIDGVDRYLQSTDEPLPSWLKQLREQSLTKFNQLGVPTTHDEDWKYTNIAPVVKRKYTLVQDGNFSEKEQLSPYLDPREINIVLVNGIFSSELSNLKGLPKGIRILTWQEALTNAETDLSQYFNTHEINKGTAFAALNQALANDGVVIKIEDKTIVENLIHIVSVTSFSGPDLITFPRTLILAGKSSEATVLESYLAFSNRLTYFSNALTEIFLAENAILHYCKAQSESLNAFHIGATQVMQERNSHLDTFSLVVGSSIARNNLDVIANGEGTQTTLNGLYCINGRQLADNHTSVDHRLPNCTSTQLYKGLLNGESHAVFNGKIFVRPIAQKTNSYQLNKNLILGKDCRVDTKPQLEIFADDVKCTHGATIGQLNEDEIFYLQTRSIPKQKAINMLARGFVDEILNTINNAAIRRKLNKMLEPTFDALENAKKRENSRESTRNV